MNPKDPEDVLLSLGGSTPDPQRVTAESPIPELNPTTSVDLSSPSHESESDTQDIGASAADIQQAAKLDLNFLSALVMPMIYKFPFPPVFLSVWIWLLSYIHKPRLFPQLALGLPRGFGKTTLMKIFIMYCILFTSKKFILIISAKASLAENILADVTDMLDEPNIKKVFGDWRLGCEKDTQAVKKFGFRGRNIILAGIGAETSLRGLNIKNERPDVMVFEDIQSRECADSEVQSNKLEEWMIGTAMKAKSPHGCMFLFVANMYPTKFSILRKLKHNPTWTKFIAGGILADGSSLWEALQPIAQLMAEFKNDLSMGKPEIFYSEVLNDENASQNNRIDLSKLPDSPYVEGDIPAGNFIIIDPATDKLGADEVSVGYFEIHATKPCLMELTEDRLSPGDTIRCALGYALKYNCRLIAVESNAYQYSLLYWFDFICKQLQIVGVESVEIYSGVRSKNSRILEMFKSLAKGEIVIEEKAKAAAFAQIIGFNPLRTDNTDGILDLLTYAPKVLEMYEEYIVANNLIESQEYEALEVLEYNSCF